MASLADCLNKLKGRLEAFDTSAITFAAEEYMRRGSTAAEAARQAVDDHLAQLDAEQARIEKDVRRQWDNKLKEYDDDKPAPEAKGTDIAQSEPTKVLNRSELPANSVVADARDQDGRLLGMFAEPHDGTEDGMRAANERLRGWLADYYGPGWSNSTTRTGITDADGNPASIISPNGRNISPVGSDAAAYTMGDLDRDPNRIVESTAERKGDDQFDLDDDNVVSLDDRRNRGTFVIEVKQGGKWEELTQLFGEPLEFENRHEAQHYYDAEVDPNLEMRVTRKSSSAPTSTMKYGLNPFVEGQDPVFRGSDEDPPMTLYRLEGDQWVDEDDTPVSRKMVQLWLADLLREGIQDANYHSDDSRLSLLDIELSVMEQALDDGIRLNEVDVQRVRNAVRGKRPISYDLDTDLARTRISAAIEKLESRVAGEMARSLVNDLYKGRKADKKFANQREFAEWLVERGGRKLDLTNAADRRILSDMMALEGLYAIRQDGNAATWYRDRVQGAKAVAGLLHEEIDSDPNAEFAFEIALAITSNGLSIETNVTLAERVFDHWKKNQKFPTNMGEGKTGPTMNTAFKVLNKMIEADGIEATRTLLNRNMTVREINAIGKRFGLKVSGEGLDTRMEVSALFGPKIGAGFFQNLAGNFEPLTMDRWWMRTWGRITGNLLEIPTDKTDTKRLQAFRDSLTPEVLKANKVRARFNPQTAKEETLRALARKMFRAYERGGFKDRSAANKTAKALVEHESMLRGAPAGARERQLMRNTVHEALNTLGQDAAVILEPADLQALIWYPEKELYKLYGVSGSRADPTDYQNEFTALAKKRGISDEQIERAVQARVQRGRDGGGTRADAGIPAGDGRAGRRRGAEDAGQDGSVENRLSLLQDALDARLRQVGIANDVAGAAVEELLAQLQDGSLRSARGSYNHAKRLITVALSNPDQQRRTINHEVIHALKALGLITDKEWSILTRAAERNTKVAEGVRRRYPKDYSRDKLLEEMVADLNAAYMSGDLKPTSVVQQLLNKIREIIEAIGNALRGNGFRSADDVLAAINTGKGRPGKGRSAPAENAYSLNAKWIQGLRDAAGPVKRGALEAVARVRVANQKIKSTKVPVGSVSSDSDAAMVFRSLFGNQAQEVLGAVVTGKNGKILQVIRHSIGGIDSAGVDVAVMIGSILDVKGAANVWFAHNHPSGRAEQSGADMRLQRAFDSLMTGAGVESQGMLVITPDENEYSYFRPNQYQSTSATFAPTRGESTVAVTERQFAEYEPGTHSITSPQSVIEFVRDNLEESDSGLLILDTRHQPVGFVSLNAEQMKNLRAPESRGGKPRFAQILQALHKMNGRAAVVVMPQREFATGRASTNIAGMVASLGSNNVRLLDVITRDGRGKHMSYADSGGTPDTLGSTFYDLNDDAPFFSALRRGVEGLKQEKGRGPQMLSMIRKLPGIRQQEIAETGLARFLAEDRTFTKAEILEHLDGATPTMRTQVLDDESVMYASETLPGGREYREYLISSDQLAESGFADPHFDVPGLVAHVRATRRTIGGKETLLIEEVQSDAHNQMRRYTNVLREAGYNPDAMSDAELEKARNDASDEYGRLKKESLSPGQMVAGEGSRAALHSEITSAAKLLRALEDHRTNRRQIAAGESPSLPPGRNNAWVGMALRGAILEAMRGDAEQVAILGGEGVKFRTHEIGDWAGTFYDETVPRIAKDVARRLDPDAKVTDQMLELGLDDLFKFERRPNGSWYYTATVSPNDETLGPFDSEAEARLEAEVEFRDMTGTRLPSPIDLDRYGVRLSRDGQNWIAFGPGMTATLKTKAEAEKHAAEKMWRDIENYNWDASRLPRDPKRTFTVAVIPITSAMRAQVQRDDGIPLYDLDEDLAEAERIKGRFEERRRRGATVRPRTTESAFRPPDQDGPTPTTQSSPESVMAAQFLNGFDPSGAAMPSFLKDSMLGFQRLFEGASDRMRRLGLEPVAQLIDNVFDQEQANAGVWNEIMADPIRKSLPADRATFKRWARAWDQRQNKEAARVYDGMSETGKALVDAWRKAADVTGTMNQAAGVQVFDPKTGGMRPIGKAAQYYPRKLEEWAQNAIHDPINHPADKARLVELLIEKGLARTPADAERFIKANGPAPDRTSNDYFSAMEKARSDGWPAEVYDYSVDTALEYGKRWAERLAQISVLGQEGTKFGEAFDAIISAVQQPELKDYLRRVKERIYNVAQIDPTMRVIAALNMTATGLQLGNPRTALQNLITGSGLNYVGYGKYAAATQLRALAMTSQDVKDAEAAGILRDDILSVQRDLSESTGAVLSAFTAGTMKIGGYNITERMIRMHAYLAGKMMVRDFVQSVGRDPMSGKSRRLIAWVQRNGFDYERLLAEGGEGPYTDRVLRYVVNLPQGSYKINMTPVLIDEPIGRFLFKYQKYSTQVTRMTFMNHMVPFMKSVRGGEKITVRDPVSGQMVPKRAFDFVSMLRLIMLPPIYGAANKYVRWAAFGTLAALAGPDWEDIEDALKNDELRKAAALALQLAWESVIMSGALGVFQTPVQIGRDITDMKSIRNPLDPPALGPIKATWELLEKARSQGRLTGQDLDSWASRSFSLYNSTIGSRVGRELGSNLGMQDKAVTERYRLAKAQAQKEIRRYGEEAGVAAMRRIRGTGYSATPQTPVNRRIRDAVVLGRPEEAKQVLRQHIATLEGDERLIRAAIASARTHVRSQQPITFNGQFSEEERRNFLAWAKGNLPPAKYARISQLDLEYRRNARAAGMMSKEDPVAERRAMRAAEQRNRPLTAAEQQRLLRRLGV